jgi:hypothetical protein
VDEFLDYARRRWSRELEAGGNDSAEMTAATPPHLRGWRPAALALQGLRQMS